MNILLFHPHKESLEMIGFVLESQMSLKVQSVSTFQAAVDYLLEEESADLIITCQQLETDKLFKYVLSTSSNIPVILIEQQGQEPLPPYPDIRVLARVQQTEVPGMLVKTIRDNFSEILQNSESEEFCRIKPEFLLRVIPLKGDIFIRLSSVKFVKLFRQGSVFTNDDLERILNRKKISYLYVKKADSLEFVERFKTDIAVMVQQAIPEDPGLMDKIGEVHEQIQELSNRLGFTKEVQELVHQNVNLTLKAIGTSPQLSRALATSQMRHKNFISSHSVMLANIACSIAAQMQWPSNTTFQKIILAALLHDFVFQDPELAKISTKKELEGLYLKPTDEKFLTIKNHPIKCAELVKGMHDVPGDVDIIVLQHHERPDGSGFPKGTNAHQIAPLAAVLIVAHDILDAISRDSEAFELKRFLRKCEPDYQGGSFRKIWKLLHSQEGEVGGGTAA